MGTKHHWPSIGSKSCGLAELVHSGIQHLAEITENKQAGPNIFNAKLTTLPHSSLSPIHSHTVPSRRVYFSFLISLVYFPENRLTSTPSRLPPRPRQTTFGAQRNGSTSLLPPPPPLPAHPPTHTHNQPTLPPLYIPSCHATFVPISVGICSVGFSFCEALTRLHHLRLPLLQHHLALLPALLHLFILV